MDPPGSEGGGSDGTHYAILSGGQSTEMWDHEAGRHSNRQAQGTLQVSREGFPSLRERAWEKGQEIFLEAESNGKVTKLGTSIQKSKLEMMFPELVEVGS